MIEVGVGPGPEGEGEGVKGMRRLPVKYVGDDSRILVYQSRLRMYVE